MAEYIDKEAFKKCVEERYCKPCKAAKKDYNGCRCLACWVDDMLDVNHFSYINSDGDMHYCSYGERKEDKAE